MDPIQLVRVFGFLLPVAAVTTAAGAQSGPTETTRRDLVNRADEARAAGDHSHAIDLAERAGQLRLSPSLGLFLAQENQAIGRWLQALDHARRCAREAEADTQLRNRDQILTSCRGVAAEVEPHVGRLTVRVPRPAPAGMIVRVAGAEVNPALWDESFPVDPGELQVEATCPTCARFQRSIRVAPGGQEEVRVTQEQESTAQAPVADTRPLAAPRSRTAGVGPWIVTGAGAASLVASVVFILLRNSERDARDQVCGMDPGVGACRDNDADRADALAHDSAYRTYTTATNVAIGIGAAGVAAGVVWLLIAWPRGEQRPVHSALRFGITPTAGGGVIGLGGTL